MDEGNQDQWILDSGASQHVTNQYKLLYYKININEVMEMSNEPTERQRTSLASRSLWLKDIK